MNNIKGILLRWDKLSISSMYLLNLSISGLLFSLTMPIWILQIISGQVRGQSERSRVKVDGPRGFKSDESERPRIKLAH